jgi:hypothetical protein
LQLQIGEAYFVSGAEITERYRHDSQALKHPEYILRMLGGWLADAGHSG